MHPSRTTIRRRHAQHILRLLAQQEDAFLDKAIARTKQESMAIARQTPSCPNDVPLMPTTGSPDRTFLSCRDAATLVMPLDSASSVPPNYSQCREATFLLLQHTKYGCTSTMHPPLYRQPLIQVPTGITSVNLTNARQTCPFCDHLPSVLV